MTNEDIVLSIETLKEYTSGMIKKCQEAVLLSVESMVNRNLEQAKRIMENDDDIDLLREYIRDRSVELMASKHPMIKDLRYIYVLSDISTELERIGDYAVNICKEIVAIEENEYIKELIDIPRMSEMCSKMLEALNEAFLNEDDELAYQIALTDRELDKLYSKIREDSLKVMYRDPETSIYRSILRANRRSYNKYMWKNNICEEGDYGWNRINISTSI